MARTTERMPPPRTSELDVRPRARLLSLGPVILILRLRLCPVGRNEKRVSQLQAQHVKRSPSALRLLDRHRTLMEAGDDGRGRTCREHGPPGYHVPDREHGAQVQIDSTAGCMVKAMVCGADDDLPQRAERPREIGMR